MLLLKTSGLYIDCALSKQYNGVYINGGLITGQSVHVTVMSMIVDIDKNILNDGVNYVQIYINPFTRQVLVENKPVEESTIKQSFHIGGVVVDKYNNENFFIKTFQLQQSGCLEYNRSFSSEFGDGFNKILKIYDLESTVTPGIQEFSQDLNQDFAIQLDIDAFCSPVSGSICEYEGEVIYYSKSIGEEGCILSEGTCNG